MILKGGPYPGLEAGDADAVICTDEHGQEHVYDDEGGYVGRLVSFGGDAFVVVEVLGGHRAVPATVLAAVECIRLPAE